MKNLSSVPPTCIVLYSSTPEGGWAREREGKSFFYPFDRCHVKRAVGGGRSKGEEETGWN